MTACECPMCGSEAFYTNEQGRARKSGVCTSCLNGWLGYMAPTGWPEGAQSHGWQMPLTAVFVRKLELA